MSIYKKKKKKAELNAKFLSKCEWSSVLDTFQVYYKTAIFNPESNSENEQ